MKFNTKRKRSNNIEVASPLFSGSGSNQENSNFLIIEQNVQKEQEYDPTTVEVVQQELPESSNARSQSQDGKLPVKVKNQILKKEGAIRSLKLVPGKNDMKHVCKVIDKFRLEETSRFDKVNDEDLKRKLIVILTEEDCSVDKINKLLAESKSVRDFFQEDLIQETLACSAMPNVLKDFPPDFKENTSLTLIGQCKEFAPKLLSLLTKVCSKVNQPVTEKQGRKLVQLISQFFLA